MGQKVNPHGLRVGIIKGWDSQWCADKKDFGKCLKEDYEIRKALTKMLGATGKEMDKDKTRVSAGLSKITIERAASTLTVNIYCGRPGVAIGKQAQGIPLIKSVVSKICPDRTINVNVLEVKKVDMDAQLVARSIADQLERRAQFRRAMKQGMQKAMRAGAKGVKTMVSGRLDGAEIARREQYHEGSIPLQTLRADIDYGFAEASTSYGMIGVKVWIYKGEVFTKLGKGGND